MNLFLIIDTASCVFIRWGQIERGGKKGVVLRICVEYARLEVLE